LIHFSVKSYPVTFQSVIVPTFDEFAPGNQEQARLTGPSYWLIFQGGRILISAGEGNSRLPFLEDLSSLGLEVERAHYLGMADGNPCRTVEVPTDVPAPEAWTFEGIRSLFGRISNGFFAVAARALEVLEWDRTHRFCGTCGTAPTFKEGERARECPSCGHLGYPRISPAVIVAVVKEDKLLLARARRFPPGFYSVLAGYVEPGETLEECVAREVREETGIEVKNLRYFASQPWPFPHSLMVAFTAEYAGGEVRIDESELLDAGWYAADALPSLPDPITVARRLINWFTARAKEGT
jgi:NAD+ diphosphatase